MIRAARWRQLTRHVPTYHVHARSVTASNTGRGGLELGLERGAKAEDNASDDDGDEGDEQAVLDS